MQHLLRVYTYIYIYIYINYIRVYDQVRLCMFMSPEEVDMILLPCPAYHVYHKISGRSPSPDATQKVYYNFGRTWACES